MSELLKLGGDNYENMKQFSVTVEEKLFRMSAHRDRALTYKTEEVQLTAVDEVYVEQDKSGHVVKQLCRVRVFFLSFLSGIAAFLSPEVTDTKCVQCWYACNWLPLASPLPILGASRYDVRIRVGRGHGKAAVVREAE